MLGKKYQGQVVAEVLELRFAFSGKLVYLSKKTGDFVRRGEIVASLDKKLLQLELDQKLADSMVIRNKKVMIQADLDASVRDVELAKYKLDQADLISPASGRIVDLGGNIVGLNITPSANALKIIKDGLIFRIKIRPEEVQLFNNPAIEFPIDLPKIGQKIFAKSGLPYPDLNLDYVVDFALPESNNIPLGIEGYMLY
jgi:multidrug resistance efflux pump